MQKEDYFAKYKGDMDFEFEDKYHTIFKKHEPRTMGMPEEHHMAELGAQGEAYGKLAAENPNAGDLSDVVEGRKFFALFNADQNTRHHPHFEEKKAQCDIKIEHVEVEAGVKIECYVVKPKDLEGTDNSCYYYGHGGGGVFWSPEIVLPKLVDMATRWRIVIVAPDYRKAPEVKQPRGYEDFRAAYKHFHENATMYGFHKDKMVMGGMSGGGYEALGAAQIMAQHDELHMIKLLVLECAMMTGSVLYTPMEEMNDFEKGSADSFVIGWKYHATDFDKQFAECDVTYMPGLMSTEVAAKLPPTAVITCEFDIVKREAYVVAKTCREAGSLVAFCDWPGQSHAWFEDSRSPQAEEYLKQHGELIKAYTEK